MTVDDLKRELKKAGDKERAVHSQRFFKTGKGEYGEGDVFLGITVPKQREIAKKYLHLPLRDAEKLIKSAIHEERLTGSIILVEQYKKADERVKKQIYDFYLNNTKYINNWDIIDGSAPLIVGDFLWRISLSSLPVRTQRSSTTPRLQTSALPQTILTESPLEVLVRLAKSDSIWEKRISILATFAFIHSGESEWTFKIAEILLHDEHDLIQKAVGWLLREVGKRVSQKEEQEFLNKHYKTMPRTMLRYAIERFDEPTRQTYLEGTA